MKQVHDLRDARPADPPKPGQPGVVANRAARVLSEINQISSDSNQTSHQRYGAIFKLLERRDRELADAFNDLRRSTAWRQLALIQSHGLLTEKEMADFTAETRGVIELLAG